jgi:hypothetical protein
MDRTAIRTGARVLVSWADRTSVGVNRPQAPLVRASLHALGFFADDQCPARNSGRNSGRPPDPPSRIAGFDLAAVTGSGSWGLPLERPNPTAPPAPRPPPGYLRECLPGKSVIEISFDARLARQSTSMCPPRHSGKSQWRSPGDLTTFSGHFVQKLRAGEMPHQIPTGRRTAAVNS